MAGSRLYSLFSFALCLGVSAVSVQAQSGVDALGAQINNKTVTVNIQGLRLSRSVLFKGVDTRIADGAIQKRAFGTQSAKDEVLNPGDPVRVTKVEAATDKNSDLLRVTIAAADGLTVPVAFVLPKGALAGQSEAQLEQVVGAAFDVRGNNARRGVPGRTPAPAAEPAGWRIVAGTGGKGNQASIAGTARNGTQQSTAQLRLSCAGAEVRIHKNVTPDLSSLSCEGDDTDSGVLAVKFKVGDQPEEAGGVCYDEDPNKTAFVALPIDLGNGGLDEVVGASGKPLHFMVDLGGTPASQLQADFQLPQDASTIAFLSSCAKPKVNDSDSKNPVVACPDLAGKGLRSAAVLTASGKPYKGPPDDNDIGQTWNIPKATKAHPVRPKLTLECSYGDGLKSKGEGEALEKQLIPIPSTATFCVSRGSAELGEAYANCSAQ